MKHYTKGSSYNWTYVNNLVLTQHAMHPNKKDEDIVEPLKKFKDELTNKQMMIHRIQQIRSIRGRTSM